MSTGKTIQIYSPSGEPRGVRIAEITTRIVQAVVVPRARLDEGLKRDELSGVGLYLLFGESEPGGRPMVYIGEAEDCAERFKGHNRTKDFWNIAVAIVSRTGSFTKAHGKLLEFLAIAKAKQAGRYELDNLNAGGEPVMPEWMRADVLEVFETAEILLGSLGYPVFEPPAASSARPDVHLFYCRRGGAEARGVYNEDGFVVLAGSVARVDMTDSASASLRGQREELIDSGAIAIDGSSMKFHRDTVFASPSTAASVVCGGSANGWIEWKDDRGQTLDQVYRQQES
jgi:hypothetical protein